MPINKLIQEMEKKAEGTAFEELVKTIKGLYDTKKKLLEIIKKRNKENLPNTELNSIIREFDEALVNTASFILGNDRPTSEEMRALVTED